MLRLKIVHGDITKQSVDAIVNSANTYLISGGGVDGAIHRAAGAGLEEECRQFGGCPTGEAVITSAHGLAALHVIHAVGPRYFDGERGEAELLRRCYRNIFKLITEHRVNSVAIPAISTGVFHYPAREAAQIALESLTEHLELNNTSPLSVVSFVLYSPEQHKLYAELIESMPKSPLLNWKLS